MSVPIFIFRKMLTNAVNWSDSFLVIFLSFLMLSNCHQINLGNYGSFCLNSKFCLAGPNLKCSTETELWGACVCNENATYINKTKKCELLATSNKFYCSYNEQCQYGIFGKYSYCNTETKLCQCLDTTENEQNVYWINGTCNYKLSCSNFFHCKGIGSYCDSNGDCNCNQESIYHWNQNKCVALATNFNSNCASHDQCWLGTPGAHSHCDWQTSTCKCNTDTVTSLASNKCIVNKKYHESCKWDEECQASLGENSECKFTPIGASDPWHCVCKAGYYYYDNKKLCQVPKMFGDSCESHDECQHGLGQYALCGNNGTCNCRNLYAQLIKNGECYLSVPFDKNCSQDEECQVSLGDLAICAKNNSNDTLGLCQCGNQAVYSSNLSKCFMKKVYNDTCLSSDECRASLGPKVICEQAYHPDPEMVCFCPTGKVCRSEEYYRWINSSQRLHGQVYILNYLFMITLIHFIFYLDFQ